jgi:hypothetical protein
MRLTELRHFSPNSSRMAEMSVPAWPMPIHHTKLMMPKAQATGMLLPQVPTPFRNVTPMATTSSTVSAEQIPTSIHHPRPGAASTGRSSDSLSSAFE